jgi:uncharacterized membrane protein (DUF2068 family)
MKRPVGVVVTAVLLILGSLYLLLMAGIMALSGAFMPTAAGGAAIRGAIPRAIQGAPVSAQPAWMNGFMLVIAAICLGLAAWGIITTVGLFRLRRWARYSALVIGGGMALLGFFRC